MKKILQYITNLWYAISDKNITIEEGGKMSLIDIKLEEMANDILVKNDMLKIPVDLIKIAKANNIEVYSQKLPEMVSGAIRYDSDNKKFQILLQKSDSNNRQRFTLAHELGHFFLDKEVLMNDELHIDYLYRKVGYVDEKEIDYFAGALLMDRELLTKLYNLNPSIKDLAEAFEVSESAMTVRLTKLGLI